MVSTINSSIFVHGVIGLLFILIIGFCLFTGFLPTHDAIEWHGAYHYFYNSIARGIMPYWNPYSQTGTSFFVYFQPFGLLLPSQFVSILIQKLTGCNTMTTYILHYFFMYYLFIMGTYYTLRVIRMSRSISLLFSLILFLSVFPTFMRQNGTLNAFFLFPFITYFLLLFFQESRVNKKGLYLFVTAFLTAIALNIYIPAWLLFYLFCGAFLAFFLNIADINSTVRFLRSRHGFLWCSACILVVLLLSAPVIGLYYELQYNSEYFPSLRFLHKNGNNLVKYYASDINEALFSETFSNNLKVSLTLGNLIGLLFEPFQRIFDDPNSVSKVSEVVLYLSLSPLLWVWFTMTKAKVSYTYFFFIIAALLLLVICNFSNQIVRQPVWTQRLMLTIFPLLKTNDVLQNAGILFLFCLVILSALGFQHMRKTVNYNSLLNIIALMILYKYIIFIPLTPDKDLMSYLAVVLLYSIIFIFSIIVIISKQARTDSLNLYRAFVNFRWAVPLLLSIIFLDLLISDWFHALGIRQELINTYHNYLQICSLLFILLMMVIMSNKVRTELLSIFKHMAADGITLYRSVVNFKWSVHLSIVIIFLDLLVFNWFHVIKVNHVLKPDYYNYLQHSNLLYNKPEHTFNNYRIPFSLLKPAVVSPITYEEYHFNSFFGHEIYNARKIAFPNVVKTMQTSITGDMLWDHFYMTSHYYDYLVNVKYDKQLITSNIATPILNFFPKSKAIFVSDKYTVVKYLNMLSSEELRKQIFIEQKQSNSNDSAFDISEFFNPERYVQYAQEELVNFSMALGSRYSANNDVSINVTDYDINHLSLIVETPYDGYLYFGDGYSKHWKAVIDEKKVKIEKTNMNFKSVYVSEGTHRIDFIYDPVLFRYSLYAYVAGNVFFVGILVAFTITQKKR